MGKQGETKRDGDTSHLLISSPRSLSGPAWGQAEAWSPGLCPGLPHGHKGLKGPNTRGTLHVSML